MSEVRSMTNKKLGIIVSITFILGCFVGCAGGGSTKTNNTIDNSKPVVNSTAKTEDAKKEAPKSTKPVTLGSGEYIVGKDVPTGRYKASGSSNLMVYGQGGKKGGNIKVNTILGNGDVGSGDYTFWAEDGDLIETHAKLKLTPVN
jgi:hypothetical protein